MGARRAAATRWLRASALVAAAAAVVAAGAVAAGASPERDPSDSPIQHVVVIYQENHSFDNVLGRFCMQTARCNGATQGTLHDGTIVPLADAADIVPEVGHARSAQEKAIHGGAMDGFDLITGCGADVGYACYSQFDPAAVPNVTALAGGFALSDATFETTTAASWVSHIALVASTTDGFYGSNPQFIPRKHLKRGPGWGCDSNNDVRWEAPAQTPVSPVMVPACIPDPSGAGPYRPSPVQWVPTIMDRLDAAGLTWKVYAGDGPEHKYSWKAGYYWQVCATFYECQGGSQSANWVPAGQVIADATAGTLPSVSLVTPNLLASQHNDTSMAAGDDWIGQVVGALETGPEWSSTAVFVTWDDCGCFYDHVTPPAGEGIRVPMLIVSPYARTGFTDSSPASFDSVLAYVEHTFGLPPLAAGDAAAYDYANAFDYGGAPRPGVPMVRERVPSWERAYISRHPPDPDDPT
jgi:phospholipase C